MCGIIGIGSNEVIQDRTLLRKGMDAIIHRGPDDSGEWWSEQGNVGLGHRRLSIIDLSLAGRQPMGYENGRLQIIFNGEIYNFIELKKLLYKKGHSFHSQSDTEVLLAAYLEWGENCLSHLNGMFAFCIYDKTKNLLFLARDRAGEKPLFYTIKNNELRFASELKALLADSQFARRINSEALDCYLSMGYVPGQRCILEGVNKLPSAHAMIYQIDTGASKIWRYWDIPSPVKYNGNGKYNEKDLLEELEELLEDAVRRQLVADVPLSVLLSGGVDSSLITALAIRSVPKLKTFTVSFAGHKKYDESVHAQLIANHFQTDHSEIEASEVKVEILPKLARQFDEPLVDSSMIPTYLVSKIIKKHCTVAIGGDGGDELFGGYGHYDRLLWSQNKLGKIPRIMRSSISRLGGFLPVGFKGRVWVQNMNADFENELPLIAAYFDPSTRKKLLSDRLNWPLVAEDIRKSLIPNAKNLLERATRMDFYNYLPEDILVKVDRSSMLNSLEIRAPFLDYKLIEFAYSKVPFCLKASATSRKILLKKLATKLLPPSFDKQRKKGFGIPLGVWIQKGDWYDFFHQCLVSSKDSIFNNREAEQLLIGQTKGRNNTERLFALVMFELWRKQYNVSL
jgi:asparagine synthase (glutamine-hydrolysing)